MNRELFLHIGYPKTGTTTLQKHFFPQHPELINLKTEELHCVRNILYDRENAFNRKVEEYAGKIKNEIKKYKKNKKFIYSNESLLSFSMFFRFQPHPYVWTLEPNSIARKLKMIFLDSGVFDSVKIIITIRKQEDILKSMYAQAYNLSYRKIKETRSFQKFLNYSLIEQPDNFIADTLQYYDMVKLYASLFGRQNVCVLLFEDFRKHKEVFVNDISSFLNVDADITSSLIKAKKENVKKIDNNYYPSDNRSLLNYSGKFLKKYFGFIGFASLKKSVRNLLAGIDIPGKKLKILMTTEDEKIIDNLFRGGNKRLAQEYNIKLLKYGYYNE